LIVRAWSPPPPTGPTSPKGPGPRRRSPAPPLAAHRRLDPPGDPARRPPAPPRLGGPPR